jgi:hypothetical protein
MSFFGDELYVRLSAIEGESTDLEAYCQSFAEMFAEVELVAREDEDGKLPWSHLLDPELANLNELLWLAQMAGVRIPIGLGLEDARSFVELAESRRRGTLAYMIELAQRLLTGTKTVFYIERYNDSAYQLRMATRTSETPDEDAVRAALLSAKPAGIVLTYDAVAGITWDEPTHAWTGAGAATWDSSADAVP